MINDIRKNGSELHTNCVNTPPSIKHNNDDNASNITSISTSVICVEYGSCALITGINATNAINKVDKETIRLAKLI